MVVVVVGREDGRRRCGGKSQKFVFHFALLVLAFVNTAVIPQPTAPCAPNCWPSGENYYKCRLNITQGCSNSTDELVWDVLRGSHGLNQTTELELACSRVERRPEVNLTRIGEFFPQLRSLSLTSCNMTSEGLRGSVPPTVQMLNFSVNALRALPETLFEPSGGGWELKTVDLSGNVRLASLPQTLLEIPSLEKLWLGGEFLPCNWIGKHLYPLYRRRQDIFPDAHRLSCQTPRPPRLTVRGALYLKKAIEEECSVTPDCFCVLLGLWDDGQRKLNPLDDFPLSFTDRGMNFSIMLNVDCTGRNLTSLPKISPHTRILNVSRNYITHLRELERPEYRNLKELVAEHNQIGNIESMRNTRFVKHFHYLNVAYNSITSLSQEIMSVLLSEVQGRGFLRLEESSVDCNCDTIKLKLLLAKHHKKILVPNRISCSNLEKKVHELEEHEVCEVSQLLWWILVGVEACLITVVLLKVFYDSRRYRRTGILPWCSEMMPRLPCDFMLEGFKEPRIER